MTTSTRVRRLAVVGSPEATEIVARRWTDGGEPIPVTVPAASVPSIEAIRDLATDASAVLVVGPRRRAPGTSVPGPVVDAADGRRVPLAWLPDTGPADLARFAEAAASVRGRQASVPTVAVLAQRSRRYRHLAGRIVHHLAEASVDVCRWTADELMRDDLVRGLGLGVGAAIYVGHGRPVGWVGYRGVRTSHLADSPIPVGAVLSLTCLTASRRRTGLSFAEALPLTGAAASSFAAVRPTDHQENARWAVRLARTLAERPVTTIGELIAAAHTDEHRDLGYRIVGDPLAPLADAAGLGSRLAAFEADTAPPLEGGIDADPRP